MKTLLAWAAILGRLFTFYAFHRSERRAGRIVCAVVFLAVLLWVVAEILR